MRPHAAQGGEIHMHASRQKITHQGRSARLVGHGQQVNARGLVEGFADQVKREARAGVGVGELPGILLREVDQLLHRIHRQRGRDGDHAGDAGHEADGCQVALCVIGRVLDEVLRRGDDGCSVQQRIAICRRSGNRHRGNGPARPCPRLHHHGLSERLGHFRRDGAKRHVARIPQARSADHLYRFRRIALGQGR